MIGITHYTGMTYDDFGNELGISTVPFRQTFQACYEQYAELDKEPFTVLAVGADELGDPQFEIQIAGQTIIALAEEVIDDMPITVT